MKKWLNSIRSNQYFLLFILLFAYVQSIYMRMSSSQEVNAYTFTPDAALSTLFKAGVLFTLLLFFIQKIQEAELFSTRKILQVFVSSIISFLVILKLIEFFIAFIFDNIERNFNRDTFFISIFSDFLNGFIYGSFFLAYYYFKRNNNKHRELAKYHSAVSESRISQLKAQLNPHFLFNNLNILDQLIGEGTDKASDFLNEFAEIYRYVLQASEKKLTSLDDELAFAQQYFRLMQYKYGHSYNITIEGNKTNGYIVPLTLQLLIENAIQHNLGTEENPVAITINMSDNICVSNNIHLKRNVKSTNGRALNNLKEQYKLLTKKPVEIHQTGNSFSVTIPVIPSNAI